MAISVNVAIAPGFGNTDPLAAPDVTVGSGADRYAISIVGQREFGAPTRPSGVALESESLAQLGSDQSFFGVLGLATLWSLANPGSGANRSLVSTFGAAPLLAGVGGIVYDGVNQTTPTRDVDQSFIDSGAPGTSVSPSLTLTTVSGDVVVMCIVLRHTGGGSTTVSGETERVNGNNGSGFDIIVVEKAATTTSTTINPTLTFSSGDYQVGYLAVALIPADSTTPLLMGQACL